MLVVSKIQVHPKKKQIYLIELQAASNEEWVTSLELHEDLLIQYGLRKGLPITDAILNELDYETERHQAYQAALNYISYRMRSEKEVTIYLEKKGFSSSHISGAIKKLQDDHWLDDQAFAEAYVRSKKSLTSKGPSVIRQELLQKGVSEARVTDALLQYNKEDEERLAQQFADKKRNSWKNRSFKEQKQRLVQALMQKGFSSEVSQRVASQIGSDQDEDAEWEALQVQAEKALYKYRKSDGYERRMKLKQFLYRKGFNPDQISKWLSKQDDQD